MIDDHEFLGAQQVVRNDQRAQGVLGDDAAGIADDVRVSCASPRVRIESRVSMQVRTASLRLGRGDVAQFMGARIDFVCCKTSSMTLMAA